MQQSRFLSAMINLNVIAQNGQILGTLAKIKVLVRAYFTYFFVGILCVVLMLIVDSVLVQLFQQPSIRSSHYKQDEYLSSMGMLKGIFLITIEGPILEELAFRLFLNPGRVTIAVGAFFFVLFSSGIILTVDDFSLCIKTIAFCLIPLCILYIFYTERWNYYIRRYQKLLLIFSSVIFALSHIYNFDPLYTHLWYVYPFYLLPQFFLGLVTGWLRIHLGFIWAVSLHILVNGSFTWHKLFE